MPTKATPADLFDFDAWMGRPPLESCLVTPMSGGRKTLIIRANNGDDNTLGQEWAKANPDGDENEFYLHRCLVGIWQGEKDPKDIPTADIPADPIITVEQVRKLRNAILEKQWLLVTNTLALASLTAPEDPSAPSSPKS